MAATQLNCFESAILFFKHCLVGPRAAWALTAFGRGEPLPRAASCDLTAFGRGDKKCWHRNVKTETDDVVQSGRELVRFFAAAVLHELARKTYDVWVWLTTATLRTFLSIADSSEYSSRSESEAD